MAAMIGDAASIPATSLYRTIWRWHFYAGLFVVPLVIVLSITGIIYLFERELDGLVYRNLLRTPAPVSQAIAPSAQVDAALAAHPGATVTRYEPPADPGASARIELTTADGQERAVFVDPGSGRILGELDPFWQLSELAVTIHGTLLIGDWGDRIVELAACWCLLMVISGVYLWWPRGQRFTVWGTLLPRLRADGRTFWRDLHAVSGIWTAAVIGFLVITGLPWAGFWGDKLYTAAGWIGQSYPAALWDDVPASTPLMKDVVADPGWTLQGAPVPASTPGHEGPAPTLDTIVALATERGVPAGYRISYPKGETGVWTITSWTDQRWDSVTIHVDRYSGAVLAAIPFDSFGAVAKAVEYGIVLHEGRFFGLANQLVMLAAALALIVLPISGIVMWWRRRPQGLHLGAPPRPADPRLTRGLIALIVVLGVLFPLLGLSLIVVVALDQLVLRHVPALRRAFA
jgi:uncharacterized iron-regulated membrane protein